MTHMFANVEISSTKTKTTTMTAADEKTGMRRAHANAEATTGSPGAGHGTSTESDVNQSMSNAQPARPAAKRRTPGRVRAAGFVHSAGSGTGHEVMRPSPLRSVMTAT